MGAPLLLATAAAAVGGQDALRMAHERIRDVRAVRCRTPLPPCPLLPRHRHAAPLPLPPHLLAARPPCPSLRTAPSRCPSSPVPCGRSRPSPRRTPAHAHSLQQRSPLRGARSCAPATRRPRMRPSRSPTPTRSTRTQTVRGERRAALQQRYLSFTAPLPSVSLLYRRRHAAALYL